MFAAIIIDKFKTVSNVEATTSVRLATRKRESQVNSSVEIVDNTPLAKKRQRKTVEMSPALPEEPTSHENQNSFKENVE